MSSSTPPPRRSAHPLQEQLQEQLEAVAASTAHHFTSPSPASQQEWHRHEHRLQQRQREVATRRRRTRLTAIGAGLAAVVAAAAVTAVVVTAVVVWPTGDPRNGHVQLIPAAPPTSGSPAPDTTGPPSSDQDAQVHLLDAPPSQTDLSTWLQPCVQGNYIQGYTVLWSASSNLSFVVGIRDDSTGASWFCSDTGYGVGGIKVSDPADTDLDGSGKDWPWFITGRVELPDKTHVVGVGGLATASTASVTVTTVDGSIFNAVVREGIWWANPIVRDCADAMTWRAFDASGAQIASGDSQSAPAGSSASPPCPTPAQGPRGEGVPGQRGPASATPTYRAPTVPTS